MTKRTVSLFILMLLLFAQAHAGTVPVAVSLIQLIANPKDYDGKAVQVIGFVSLDFEGQAIYLSQDDYKHGIDKNGLWIDVAEDIIKKKDSFDKKYLLLEGTFNAKEKGHMELWGGSIQNISRIQVWVTRGG